MLTPAAQMTLLLLAWATRRGKQAFPCVGCRLFDVPLVCISDCTAEDCSRLRRPVGLARSWAGTVTHDSALRSYSLTFCCGASAVKANHTSLLKHCLHIVCSAGVVTLTTATVTTPQLLDDTPVAATELSPFIDHLTEHMVRPLTISSHW